MSEYVWPPPLECPLCGGTDLHTCHGGMQRCVDCHQARRNRSIFEFQACVDAAKSSGSRQVQ